jgi:hypothetical protein
VGQYRRGHATRNSKIRPIEAVGEPEIVNGAATKIISNHKKTNIIKKT